MVNKILINICGFSLALFICGHFNSHSAALANIGIYLGILTAITYFIRNKNCCNINNFYLKQDKIWRYSCYSIFLFLGIFLTLSLIHLFEDNSLPVTTLIKNLVQSTLLTFILLITIKEKETIRKWIFISFVILNLFLIIKACSIVLKSNHTEVKSIAQGIINYYLIALPFTICACFITKHKSLKVILIIITIFTILFSAYSGIRSSVGSMAGSILILMLILQWKLNITFKAIIYSAIPILIILIIAIQFIPKGATQRLFHSHNINQFSSGRINLIKERFPLVLKYGEFIGMGYGQYSNIEYETFMFKHDAPHFGGGVRKIEQQHSARTPKGSKYKYLNDEPYILTAFYQGGILTVTSFAIMFFFIYLLLFIRLKQVSTNHSKLSILELSAISCSLISYGLMSIFGFMSLDIYMPLIIFAMYFSHKFTLHSKDN